MQVLSCELLPHPLLRTWVRGIIAGGLFAGLLLLFMAGTSGSTGYRYIYMYICPELVALAAAGARGTRRRRID